MTLQEALAELQQIAWVAEENHDAFVYERATNVMDAIRALAALLREAIGPAGGDFSMSRELEAAIDAVLVQNEPPVNASMRLSAGENGPVVDSDKSPEAAP